MKRELRFGAVALRGRPMVRLAGWSVPEAVPAFVSGLAIARSVDDGFLAGRPAVGLLWLAAFVLAGAVGAVGSRHAFRALGEIVEPLRDGLVRRVVGSALRRGATGQPDDGAMARLTRHVEVARDSYAGIVGTLRAFVATVAGTTVGAFSVAPDIAPLILAPFALGAGLFAATLGLAADLHRACILADEQLGEATRQVVTGLRDVTASGAEAFAATLVSGPIVAQGDAERALFRVTALRMGCFLVGGWGPVILLVGAGPWLVGRGLSAGALMGGLTYVLFGLQPALHQLITGLGGGGLRFVVTVGRILDATDPTDATHPTTTIPAADGPAIPAPRAGGPAGHELVLRRVCFAYGPHAEPVLNQLDLTIAEGDHIAVVGPSGIGKSTLVAVLCGLIRPDAGSALVGGTVAADLGAERLAAVRVLIPQEAFVFSATVRENLTYLRPQAGDEEITRAATAVGAGQLIARLGGLSASLRPADLSAGERQLLALARAYLSPARIVILDEATCHLDAAAERRAEEAFTRRGGTLIVVAHRMSSAGRARRILVLDGSRATIGDHPGLLRDCALYRELAGAWGADDVLDEVASGEG